MLSINIRVLSHIQKEFANKRVENGIHANCPKVGVAVAVLALDEIDFNRTFFFLYTEYQRISILIKNQYTKEMYELYIHKVPTASPNI